MANSFNILADLKNRDQSPRKMTGVRAPQRCSVFAARVVFDAKNQNEPSETKPPIIHNLSHHFSFGRSCFSKGLQQRLFSQVFLLVPGTSALAALIFGRHSMVANAGDGRAVLCRNGEAIDMSQDHKPIYLP
ncbi:hypothetical protein IGI04_033918 [Brassica rapa subsp. trilocularis]|uniref:PPM-type phosphatase domain-containing protein n=1 Tax=Brassica rapa subsp. trilocularis TaxID=1813537 RepID=A0ABQ7L795_BRACM|nr:hypothetical protein IGI04_033918 [Brassica rapa subsp. trilocularis]